MFSNIIHLNCAICGVVKVILQQKCHITFSNLPSCVKHEVGTNSIGFLSFFRSVQWVSLDDWGQSHAELSVHCFLGSFSEGRLSGKRGDEGVCKEKHRAPLGKKLVEGKTHVSWEVIRRF